MKQVIKNFSFKALMSSVAMFAVNAVAFAQDQVVVTDTAGIGNWFERNWMYVAGGVLLLIILFSIGSSRRSKSITTRETNDGLTRTTTTTTTDTEV